jgi:hypothetical protein
MLKFLNGTGSARLEITKMINASTFSDPHNFSTHVKPIHADINPDPDPLFRGTDPRSGSEYTPKCHGSTTLIFMKFFCLLLV